MTVFKTFLKILNKCKVPILIYTVFLIIFSVFGMQANENVSSFEAVKPEFVIVNEDEETGLTESFIEYMRVNGEERVFENEEEIADALFYRNVNYVIYIPAGFGDDFLAGKEPRVRVESTGDYVASLANMLVQKYLKVADTYRLLIDNEEDMVEAIEKTLDTEIEVEVTSKVDMAAFSKAATYYNFTNYCILAGAIFIIAIVMAIFKKDTIEKRTRVSSVDYKVFNRKLFLCNSLFTIGLWAVYVIISFFIVGKAMWSMHGLLLILNSLVFSICALAIAFLLGSVVKNKEAISGIVNVIALGSSFLCGAFVPVEYLPKSVLNVAHVLPSYWFIQTNEAIKVIEVISFETVVPLIFNMGIVLTFAVLFFMMSNGILKRKEKKS